MPGNGGGRAPRPGLDAQDTADQSESVAIVADRQRRARQRVQAIDRRCRIARMAERAMPLTIHYGPRLLLTVPLGQFLAEGWWAA